MNRILSASIVGQILMNVSGGRRMTATALRAAHTRLMETTMTEHEQLVERVARADAAFDGRPWDSMSRADRNRYLERTRTCAISTIAEALRGPTERMVESALPVRDSRKSFEQNSKATWSAMLSASPLNGEQK